METFFFHTLSQTCFKNIPRIFENVHIWSRGREVLVSLQTITSVTFSAGKHSKEAGFGMWAVVHRSALHLRGHLVPVQQCSLSREPTALQEGNCLEFYFVFTWRDSLSEVNSTKRREEEHRHQGILGLLCVLFTRKLLLPSPSSVPSFDSNSLLNLCTAMSNGSDLHSSIQHL